MPNPKETTFQAAYQHPPGPRSFVEARVRQMSALPRNEATAPGMPALWLLQRQGCQRGFRLVSRRLHALLFNSGFLAGQNGSKTPMITIAVDAMGGDNAPRPEVEGSVLAARELGVRVMLVGQPAVDQAGAGQA